MSQRTKVAGTRSCTLWLLAFIAIVLVVGMIAGGLFVLLRVQPQQTLEQHYQAGVAFQKVSDWAAAEAEYKQVITLDANYKDVQTRLAEVRTKLQVVTATVVALAQATAVAAPTATAQALEAHYQKGLGYMNMGQWPEAKMELEQVFAVNPNYKDVQTKLKELEAVITKLTPTAKPLACSISETLTAPFTGGVYAVRTSNSYQGTIIITVSGVGQAAGTQYGDAFYIFTDSGGNQIAPKYLGGWVLRINGQLAVELIPDQQVPAYRGDHIYTFQINAPGGTLAFGVSDTSLGDNTGSYAVVLCKP